MKFPGWKAGGDGARDSAVEMGGSNWPELYLLPPPGGGGGLWLRFLFPVDLAWDEDGDTGPSCLGETRLCCGWGLVPSRDSPALYTHGPSTMTGSQLCPPSDLLLPWSPPGNCSWGPAGRPGHLGQGRGRGSCPDTARQRQGGGGHRQGGGGHRSRGMEGRSQAREGPPPAPGPQFPPPCALRPPGTKEARCCGRVVAPQRSHTGLGREPAAPCLAPCSLQEEKRRLREEGRKPARGLTPSPASTLRIQARHSFGFSTPAQIRGWTGSTCSALPRSERDGVMRSQGTGRESGVLGPSPGLGTGRESGVLGPSPGLQFYVPLGRNHINGPLGAVRGWWLLEAGWEARGAGTSQDLGKVKASQNHLG